MLKPSLLADRFRIFALLFVFLSAVVTSRAAQVPKENGSAASACRIEAVDFQGWHGQQISNAWVKLIFVPQNGGRLMQLIFAGHPYLFVNPRLAGQYFPPTNGKWFNYGGDKLWLLPEGDNDEQHWPGNSDLIDDGPFTFRKLSEGKRCEVELTSPADPQTGIQFSRTIRLEADSPRVRFHASMKNISGHTVDWSMQSVSQYNTADPNSPAGFNHNFWTFTPANSASSYLNRYHVRFGPAENPAVGVRDDGLFTVHYTPMAAELWLDSSDGWLTVMDGNSGFAMVERFEYEPAKAYPGKASVIFWTNGAEMHLNSDGIPSVSADADAAPRYLEAELNSPMCKLRPGESCSFDTEWSPTRAGNEFHGVTDAGILAKPLKATETDGSVRLSGSFGVFFAGHLMARFYDGHGSFLGNVQVADVSPTQMVSLDTKVSPPGKAARVSLHLEDESGLDLGSLNEVEISPEDNR